ncbi:hypothetical protein P4S72_15810 [Vibrio sp. PP-XX7]
MWIEGCGFVVSKMVSPILWGATGISPTKRCSKKPVRKKPLSTTTSPASFNFSRKLLLDLELLTITPTTPFSLIAIQIGNFQSHAIEYGPNVLENVLSHVKTAATVFHSADR